MDALIIASGQTARHVIGIARTLFDHLKKNGYDVMVEGEGSEWVVVDCGKVMVSLSRSEVRNYYKLESRWLGYDRHDEMKEQEGHEAALQQTQ